MAGTIVSDVLQDGAGNSTATTNAISGSAKAWVNFSGITTVSIKKSYNISSVTRSSAGVYVITMTTAMADANYAIQMSCASASGSYIYVANLQAGSTPTTTSFTIQGLAQISGTTSGSDLQNAYIAVFD
jgi:hypothetical protein